jgi:ribosomal protein L32
MAKHSSMVRFSFQSVKFRNSNNKRGKRLAHDERQAMARSLALENNGEVPHIALLQAQCGGGATFKTNPKEYMLWKNTLRREVECGFAKTKDGLKTIKYSKVLKIYG